MLEPLPSHADLAALEASAGYLPTPKAVVPSPKAAVPVKAASKQTPKHRRPGRHVVQTREEATSIRLPVVSSMAAATNICHVPFDLMRLAKQKGCAAFDASSRVDIDALLRWLFKTGVVVFPDDASVEISSLSFAQRDKRAVALTKEYNLKKLEGKLIDRPSVAQALAKGMSLLFQKIDNEFGLMLPPILKGCSETEIQKRLMEAAETFKSTLRDELKALATVENTDILATIHHE